MPPELMYTHACAVAALIGSGSGSGCCRCLQHVVLTGGCASLPGLACAAAFPSCVRSILTEIYRCHACSFLPRNIEGERPGTGRASRRGCSAACRTRSPRISACARSSARPRCAPRNDTRAVMSVGCASTDTRAARAPRPADSSRLFPPRFGLIRTESVTEIPVRFLSFHFGADQFFAQAAKIDYQNCTKIDSQN
jgi:hypothetical protein